MKQLTLFMVILFAVSFVNGQSYLSASELSDAAKVDVEVKTTTDPAFSHIACDAPVGLHTTNVGFTTATINWGLVPDAYGYEIKGMILGSGNYISFILPNGNATQFAASHLEGATSYSWQIRAICALDTSIISPWSALDTFTTMSCPTPDSLIALITSSTSATISWEHILGSAGTWVHLYSVDSSFSAKFDIFQGDSTSIPLEGLDCNTKYVWTVKIGCGTLSSLVLSEFSATDTFITGCDTCACEGKMNQVTVVYNGANGSTVEVIAFGGTVVDTKNNVNTGDILVLSSADYGLTDWHSKFYLSANGGADIQIHTSCSQIILGQTFGYFTVVGHVDKHGNVCALDSIPPYTPPPCDCDGKMDQVTAIFQGSNGSTVDVISFGGNTVATLTNVDNGDTLIFSSADYGLTDWHAKFYVSVNGGSNTQIHTSCSQLILGQTIGMFKVIGHRDNKGNVCVEGQTIPKRVVDANLQSEEYGAQTMTLEAYPNPFSEVSTISFTIDRQSEASLKVYDITGLEVATLFTGIALSGKKYSTDFSAKGVADGIYFYQLVTDDGKVVTKKLVIGK